jgi:hypothetical protein
MIQSVTIDFNAMVIPRFSKSDQTLGTADHDSTAR